jgi:hypothetical protein
VIWLAVRPEMAFADAALTGFGFSLVYPGFGVEAVRRVPTQSRGLAREPTRRSWISLKDSRVLRLASLRPG